MLAVAGKATTAMDVTAKAMRFVCAKFDVSFEMLIIKYSADHGKCVTYKVNLVPTKPLKNVSRNVNADSSEHDFTLSDM